MTILVETPVLNGLPMAEIPPDVERETVGEMVPVMSMFADGLYSRGIGEALVQQMAADFDRSAVGVLYVSLRPDGRYAVLDGNHRWAAAMAAGITRLPCRVYLDLTPDQEAALFAKFNRDRRAMRPGEIFKARLAARESRAMEIQRIVHGFQLDLALTGGAEAGRIQAVATLDKIYSVHGAIGLREVLALAHEAWGREARAYTQQVLSGLAAFWVRYRHQYTRSRFIDRLKLAGPTQLLAKSNAFRTVVIGMSPEQAFGRTLLETYNGGLRPQSRLPEWPSKAQGDTAKANVPNRVSKAVATRKAKKEQRAA